MWFHETLPARSQVSLLDPSGTSGPQRHIYSCRGCLIALGTLPPHSSSVVSFFPRRRRGRHRAITSTSLPPPLGWPPPGTTRGVPNLLAPPSMAHHSCPGARVAPSCAPQSPAQLREALTVTGFCPIRPRARLAHPQSHPCTSFSGAPCPRRRQLRLPQSQKRESFPAATTSWSSLPHPSGGRGAGSEWSVTTNGVQERS